MLPVSLFVLRRYCLSFFSFVIDYFLKVLDSLIPVKKAFFLSFCTSVNLV